MFELRRLFKDQRQNLNLYAGYKGIEKPLESNPQRVCERLIISGSFSTD